MSFMAFDGIVTKKIVHELSEYLINGKINKIYEPNKNEVILDIYNGKNYALDINISSNYRINLTTKSKPNPLHAPNFCMVLRKHLLGFKISNIYLNELERIIYIDLEGYNELNDFIKKKLIVELMGKHSNIILLNDNNIIIDSLRHLDSTCHSYRDILPAHNYILPVSDKIDFLSISEKDFLNLIIKYNRSDVPTENVSNKNKQYCVTLSKIISDTFTGISKCFVINRLEQLHICDENYTISDILNIYSSIKNIINNLCNNQTSCIEINNGKDFVISNVPNSELLQCNFFIDDFYFNKEANDLVVNYRNNLLKLMLSNLKKISKKIQNINLKLKECENMDTYRIYGELITSNLYRINLAENVSSIILENYYDNNSPIEIPLDKSISPSYNAKKYFKKYHKLKNTLEIVSIQKQEAEKELEYIESIIYELENCTSIDDIDEIYEEISENNILNISKENNSKIKKNKVNKRKFHNEYEPITYNVDDFIVFVGKNNKQNDYITTKLGKNDDLWFHTKDIRGSHVLLKCNGKEVKTSTIISCCQIAAFHSKAKLSSNVPVDYCKIKYVRKPSGSKPGMVIYTNNETINVMPSIQ